ncbi:MAG: sugar phosphate isomerase/epimerase family protein [Bryobacteraceae bacterium]
MQLGTSSYAYVWAVGVPGWPPPQPLGADELLDKALRLGVRVVQIADNLPLDRMTEARRRALFSRAASCGVRIEAGTRGIRPELVLPYVRIAAECGSPILRTLIDSPGHEPSEDEAIALLRALVPELKAAGVVLAIENHDRFKAVKLRRIVECAGPEWIGVCLDTANSLGCGEGIEHVAAVLAPVTVNLHIKDFMARRLPHNKGFIIEGCPAGQGLVDIPALLGVLRGAGRDCNAILELWPPPEPELSASIAKEEVWVEASIAYLRPLIESSANHPGSRN